MPVTRKELEARVRELEAEGSRARDEAAFWRELHAEACEDLAELAAFRDEVLNVCSAPPALDSCPACLGQRVYVRTDAHLNVFYDNCAMCRGVGFVLP